MRTADLRLWGALLLLVWLASPYWPTTVDDVYISVGFAQQWADTGALTWVDGARVEGYSNFLWVALLALAAHIGTDPGLVAQLLALVCAGGVLAVLHTRLPAGVQGTAALLATAALAPLSYWSVVGMETTLYSLLLVLGWLQTSDAVRRRDTGAWAAGLGWLALASLTRLEGVGHLGIALGLRTVLPSRASKADAGALAVLAAWVAYHGLRVAWYGAVLPTPVLVKISGQEWGWAGLEQATSALFLGAGTVGLCAGLAWPGRQRAALAALPVLVQVGVLVRANGDWMGHGRLVLPGLLAAAAVVAGTPGVRTHWARWTAGASLAVAGCLWMPGMPSLVPSLRGLPNPGHYELGLDTPLAADLAWVTNHLPKNTRFLAIDAGVLSTVAGVYLVDLRGLVHRDLALAASQKQSANLLKSWRLSGSAPAWTRVATWTNQPVPAVPSWLLPEPAAETSYRYGGGLIRWFGPQIPARVSPDLLRTRWLSLLSRYPNQPFIAWQAARALRATSYNTLAKSTFARAAKRWPRHRFLDSYELATFWSWTSVPVDYQGTGLHVVDSGGEIRSSGLEESSSYRFIVRSGELTAVESDPPDACAVSWATDNTFVVGPGCSASLVLRTHNSIVLQTTIEEPEAG